MALLTRQFIEKINSETSLSFELKHNQESLNNLIPKAKLLGVPIVAAEPDLIAIQDNSHHITVYGLNIIKLDNTKIKYETKRNSKVIIHYAEAATESELNKLLNSNKVTRFETIGLFEHTEFTSIDFHNTDTTETNNMKWMFFACRSLINLDLSTFAISKTTNTEDMFLGINILENNQVKLSESLKKRFKRK
jgi:surface protein